MRLAGWKKIVVSMVAGVLLTGIWSGSGLLAATEEENPAGKAPELESCSVDGEIVKQTGLGWLYRNGGEDGDVSISFTIVDEEEAWDKEAVRFRIIAGEKEKREVVSLYGDDEALDWSESQGDCHRAEYRFYGEPDQADKYEIEIGYENKMGDGLTVCREELLEKGSTEDGSYTGMAFLLDHRAPVWEIHYTKAVRLVDDTGQREDRIDAEPAWGYSAYYGDSLEVSFEIQDEDFAGTEYVRTKLKRDEEPIEVPDVSWSMEEEGRYRGTFRIEKEEAHGTDGVYELEIFYEDAAGNAMVLGQEEVPGILEENGTYRSPRIILDTKSPKVSVSCEWLFGELSGEAKPDNTADGRDYYRQPVKIIWNIQEENGRYRELREILETAEVTDFAGETIEGSFLQTVGEPDGNQRTEEEGVQWVFSLSDDANYTIPICYEDLAGNRTDLGVKLVTVDTEGPRLTLSYSTEPDAFLEPVNYREHGVVFSDRRQTVKVTARDCISGITSIRYVVTDEQGNEKVQEIKPKQSVQAEQEFEIPADGSDFKGTVWVEAFDGAGNRAEELRGHVVESEEEHAKKSIAVITTKTSPSRRVKGENFYNTDVHLNLTFKDTYSGLGNWSYTGGYTLSGSMDYAKKAGADLEQEPTEEMVWEYSEDMVLSAASNNENGVKVSAFCMDNAGHIRSVEEIYHIDITKPVITVTYDVDEPVNGQYYRQARTATVTIRERNFDEDDVQFLITNTDGAMPSVGSWSTSGFGDHTEHVCHVTFSEDGDYTFSVVFEDLAGNRADYDRVDEFTIDRTAPVLTVTWEGQQGANGDYYNSSRTAVIDILEHNFDPADIRVSMTADGVELPFSFGWSRSGDHHTARVTFENDAEYTFSVSGMDRAENPMNNYESAPFVIDRTAPELTILGVAHRSANNGAVMPVIRCRDRNYDRDRLAASIRGCHNGIQELHMETSDVEDGVDVRLEDFAYVPEADDLYTMEVSAWDLAGNQQEARVVFSVNRFGSVYTFDRATECLAGDKGSYYTKEEPDIVVTETNVDTLTFREITCSLNGKLRTLKEGEDFTVHVSGSEESWKQYTYTIPRENFREEGTYLLTIYSEDRAANPSDNHTKGKKLEFAVDKTGPTILLAGVEDGGRYGEDSREVTLDVQDNIRLEEVEVTIDGKRFTYDATGIAKLDGRLSFVVGSAGHWQKMRVTALDCAGNETVMEELQFLITSNLFIQFYRNQALFCSVIGILMLLGLSLVIMVIAFSHESVL